jgi:hypothetical protein
LTAWRMLVAAVRVVAAVADAARMKAQQKTAVSE